MDKEKSGYGYNVVEHEVIRVGRFRIACEKILQDEQMHPYSYILMKNCVGVLCVSGKSVLLLRQYRHTLRTWEYEIPAGSIEEDENPEMAARREVLEETGYEIADIRKLGWYHLSDGSSTEIVHLYVAFCKENVGQNLEPLEKIETYWLTFEEFDYLIENNEFHQCMGVAAWQRYKSQGS